MAKMKIYSKWGRLTKDEWDKMSEREKLERRNQYVKRAMPVMRAFVLTMCITRLGKLLRIVLGYGAGTYVSAEAKVLSVGFTDEDLMLPYNLFEIEVKTRAAHECGHENDTPFEKYTKGIKAMAEKLMKKAIAKFKVPETKALKRVCEGAIGNLYNLSEDGYVEDKFAHRWPSFGPNFMRSNIAVWNKEVEMPKDKLNQLFRSLLWLAIIGPVRPKWIAKADKSLADLLDKAEPILDDFATAPDWDTAEDIRVNKLYPLVEDALLDALEDVIKQSPAAQALADALANFTPDFSGTSGAAGMPSPGSGSSGAGTPGSSSPGSSGGKSSCRVGKKKSKDEDGDGDGKGKGKDGAEGADGKGESENKDGKGPGNGDEEGSEGEGKGKGKSGEDGEDGDGDGKDKGKGGKGKSKPEIYAEHEGVTEDGGIGSKNPAGSNAKNLFGDSCKAGGGGSGSGSEEDDYYPEEELEALLAQLEEDADNTAPEGVAVAEPMGIADELEEMYRGAGDNYCADFVEKERTSSPEMPPAEMTSKANLINQAVKKIKASTEYSASSRSGKLDKRKLTRYGCGRTDIFSKRAPSEEGVCACIAWDGSGSMYGLKQTQSGNAVALIEKAFGRDIPLEIFNFTTDGSHVIHHVVKRFDETANAKSFAYGYYRSKGFSGGNKDGYSIRVATRKLEERHEKRKILIVLSDGLPSDYRGGFEQGRRDVRSAVEEAVNKDIDVIAIFFGERHDRAELGKYYKYMYEDGGAKSLTCSPEELGNELVKIFTKIALTKGRR